jgi:hypothetical protein
MYDSHVNLSSGNRIMTRAIFLITGLFFCGISQASLWSFTSDLNGSDRGFRFSSLHEAGDGSSMSGRLLTLIKHAKGSYDDEIGNLDSFGNPDLRDTLTYSGLNQGKTRRHKAILKSGLFGEHDGPVCCRGDSNPNSFMPIGGGDLHYMTLWGDDFGGAIWAGSYDYSTVDKDVGPELSPVPLPAAVYLFGSALIGLFGYQRRKLTS